jgi:hypothetical protein
MLRYAVEYFRMRKNDATRTLKSKKPEFRLKIPSSS